MGEVKYEKTGAKGLKGAAGGFLSNLLTRVRENLLFVLTLAAVVGGLVLGSYSDRSTGL